ncbi:MAG: nucleotide-binding protein [Verrucomicrobiae bacterium]
MKNLKHLILLAGLFAPVPFVTAQDAATAPVAAAEATSFSGKVVEAMNTSGYTYVRVDTGSNKLWAATTQFAVKVGDAVAVSAAMPMPNYHSQSLKRDFDVVYFTGSITVNDAAAVAPATALPPGHPPLTDAPAPALPPGHPSLTGQPAAAAPAKVDLTAIKRADGGKTVSEIFSGQKMLAGKSVSVRGKVVKYNAQIMGKNWLHIRDGSGSADKSDNDLTVTTSTPAKLGDTVLVTGIVTLNKDFGAGYKYTVILDDAQVTVE